MKKFLIITTIILISIPNIILASYLVPTTNFTVGDYIHWDLKIGQYYKVIEDLNGSYKIQFSPTDKIWVYQDVDKSYYKIIENEEDAKEYIKKERDKIQQRKLKESASFEEKYKKRQEECKGSPNWIYTKNFDKMRNKETSYAETISLNEFDLGFPYHSVSCKILIRKGATVNPSNAVNLILSEGQFHRSEIISVKFDNSKIEQYSTGEAGSGRSDILFINNHIKFVEKLMESKKVIIEVSFFQRGRRQFEFNTECLVWRWN